jgi:hypothetical protein
MPEGIRRHVRALARNLQLATIDAHIERLQAEAGQPTLFYYDTDVVLPMVMGFELLTSARDKNAELVRALLACFLLGPMHMLRPHAFELRNRLTTAKNAAGNLGPLKQRAHQHLVARGLDPAMEALREIVTGPPIEGGLTKAERFIREFRAHSSATFIAIEQISGHWTQRLKRHYGKTLHLDQLGPEMQDLVNDHGDAMRRIFLLLDKHRPDHKRENLQDAAALAILSQKVQDWTPNRAVPVVRFYSESPALWRTWQNEPELRALLTYPVDVGADGLGKPERSTDSVFRDASYFLTRARFQLAPGQHHERLANVESLLQDIEATERVEPDDFQQAIERIRWEGKSIGEIIQEFEDFSLMRGIWRSPPTGFAESLDEWTDVFAFAKGRETGEALDQKIHFIWDDLEGRLTQIVRWNDDRANLLRAARDVRRTILGTIEDPMRDLGLVRWGYDLNNAEKQVVRSVVDNIKQCTDAGLDFECAELANRMEAARGTVRDCLVVTAVLWVMRMWTEIDRLVDECASTTGTPVPASLRLIQAAARIRSVQLNPEEKEVLIERVWSLRDTIPAPQRGGYHLGLGYVLYHAWKQELRGAWIFDRSVHEMPPYARVWATKCFEAGQAAVSLLAGADELAWAYAVNHCGYVGLMTGGEPDKTQLYLLELSELQGRPAIWNARFDDTLGTAYLLRAETALRAIHQIPPPQQRATFDQLLDELRNAERFFRQAREREFGDIDVEYHLNRTAVARDKVVRLRGQLPDAAMST